MECCVSFETVFHHSFMLSHKVICLSNGAISLCPYPSRKERGGGRGLLKTEEGRERGGGKKQVFSLALSPLRPGERRSHFKISCCPPPPTLWPPGATTTVGTRRTENGVAQKSLACWACVRGSGKLETRFRSGFGRRKGKISGGYKREREKPIGHPEASRSSDSKAVVGGKATGKSWSFEENR